MHVFIDGHCVQCGNPGNVHEETGLCEAHDFQRQADIGLARLAEQGYHVAVGNGFPTCPECPDVEGDEGVSFSSAPCAICRSHLAGRREYAHGIYSDDPVNNDVIHLEVCVDCAMYIANGELPE